MEKAKQEKRTCAYCKATKKLDEYADRDYGKAIICKRCESIRYKKLEQECGSMHVALYATCAANNVPFFPLIIAQDKNKIEESEDKWQYYLNLLKETGYDVTEDGKLRTFGYGCTNMLRIFGRAFDDKTTAKFLEQEMTKYETLQGTEEQRAKWGTVELIKGMPMTREMYDELDAMYKTRAAEYKGATLSAQQQDVLTKVCKWSYLCDIYLQRGNLLNAEKLQKMVQSELAAECMRKQDEKPTEALRIDATTDALEKSNLMDDNGFLTCEETLRAFYDWYTGDTGVKKYDFSEDVCDKMILAQINAMRANADMAMLVDLPEELHIEDVFGECLPEETEKERTAKQFAGLPPAHPHPKKAGKK